MTASERLRELGDTDVFEFYGRMIPTLPLTADVVEAAERQAALVVDEEPEWKDEALPDALTALREALDES